MPDWTNDQEIDELLAIRKPGAHLEEGVVADDFVLALGVDIVNYPKFAQGGRQRHVCQDRTRPSPPARSRVRSRAARLLSGPYRSDLRFTDFSAEALATRFLPWSDEYLQLCVDGWSKEVGKRYGSDAASEIEWTAWNDQIVPEIPRMLGEFLPEGTEYRESQRGGARSRPRIHSRDLLRPVLTERRDEGPLEGAARDLAARVARVPPPVHRSVGHPDHGPLRARRHVRPPVHPLG